MVIHFICRGNAFRSLIAEAYVNSLKLENVKVFSSGTVAEQYYESNIGSYRKTLDLLRRHGLEIYAKNHFGDQLTPERVTRKQIAVCLNTIVYDEARKICDLPQQTFVWNVIDLGEYGRVAHSDEERERYMKDVLKDIIKSANSLVQTLALKPQVID